METKQHSSPSRPVISQAQNNTTLWIGHLRPHTHDHLAGQTFICPSEGLVNNIQVFASAVTQPGEVALTLHEFDSNSRSWGNAIGNSIRQVDQNDDTHWIRFELDPIELKKMPLMASVCKPMTGLSESAKRPPETAIRLLSDMPGMVTVPTTKATSSVISAWLSK